MNIIIKIDWTLHVLKKAGQTDYENGIRLFFLNNAFVRLYKGIVVMLQK